MSFTRTLAKLAAAFAVAKGVQHYRKTGGIAGLQDAMRTNPLLSGIQSQVDQMMQGFGMPGGSDAVKRAMSDWDAQTSRTGEGMAAGLAGLMSALGGAAAAGTEQATRMMDTMTGNQAGSDAMEENARLMIRAMIQAAKADGEIDDEERARIMEHLGDLDVDERAFVEAEMARPVDLHGLATDTGDQVKAQVYAMSLMAIRVDSKSEASYLDGLASALGLSDETRARVHRAMGVSPA